MKTLSNNQLDKIHAMNNPDDRANRGVKLFAWFLAFAFSAVVWYFIYKLVF